MNIMKTLSSLKLSHVAFVCVICRCLIASFQPSCRQKLINKYIIYIQLIIPLSCFRHTSCFVTKTNDRTHRANETFLLGHSYRPINSRYFSIRRWRCCSSTWCRSLCTSAWSYRCVDSTSSAACFRFRFPVWILRWLDRQRTWRFRWVVTSGWSACSSRTASRCSPCGARSPPCSTSPSCWPTEPGPDRACPAASRSASSRSRSYSGGFSTISCSNVTCVTWWLPTSSSSSPLPASSARTGIPTMPTRSTHSSSSWSSWCWRCPSSSC